MYVHTGVHSYCSQLPFTVTVHSYCSQLDIRGCVYVYGWHLHAKVTWALYPPGPRRGPQLADHVRWKRTRVQKNSSSHAKVQYLFPSTRELEHISRAFEQKSSIPYEDIGLWHANSNFSAREYVFTEHDLRTGDLSQKSPENLHHQNVN